MKELKGSQICIITILSVIILLASGILISQNINYKRVERKDIMLYDYISDINYKVNLEENNYYGETINENSLYISSLIDSINMDFKYNMSSTKEFNSIVNYTITSRLVVDHNIDITSNNLLDQENVILEKTFNNNTSKISINENILSDYQYYNDYIINYKNIYSLSSLDAKIIYTLKVNVLGNYEGKEINEVSQTSITVPLLNPTISFTKSGIDRINKTLYTETKLPLIKNIYLFIFECLLFVIGIILLIPIFVSIIEINKREKYRHTIKRYLKVYDDVIVESSVLVDLTNREIIEVTNFNDLLDAEQELHVPIVYTEKRKNKEAWFTITVNNQVWRYILKNTKKN